MSQADAVPFEAPTGIRHRVVFVATLTSLLLYLDRLCFQFLERFIREDMGITTTQVGWLQTAFFLSYALAQVPSGWFSDRYGPRIMLTIYVLLWSAFTGLAGVATGFGMFLALRIGFGLGQAGAYPTAGALLTRWVPFNRRGTASSFVALGGRLGGVLAPILTAWLIVIVVPPSVGSQLAEGDILDPVVLSQQIVGSYQRPDGKLSPLASAQKALGERVLAATGPLPSATSSNLPALLVAGVNPLLDGPPLLNPADYPNLVVEREAKSLLGRDSSTLTPGERERLNRLILEGVYPEGIRKIYARGWRPVMLAYGLLGLVVAGAFWIVFRNTPAEHPRTNAAERALIAGTQVVSPTPAASVGHLPVMALLTNTSLWLNCLTQFTTNFGWVFVATWLPRYLEEAHSVPTTERGMMTAVPIAVGCAGMYLGGPFTDRLTKRLGQRWGRALPLASTRLIAMAAFLICLLPMTGWKATAAMALMAFAVDLGVPATWAFVQDVGGRYTGSVLGWGNMWGNFGAAVSPLVLNSLVGETRNWNAAFVACALAFFISGLASLGMDSTKRVAED